MANDDNWSLYPYDPNKPAPIAFAVLLSIILVYQIYQSFFRYKWKKFGGMMIWASSVWIAGFILRAISVYNVQNVNVFIAQFVLIIVGPPLYAAAEYFILGRLMAYLPYHAPIHPGRGELSRVSFYLTVADYSEVISTFVILSAVVESLTANGAANSAGSGRTRSQVKNGLDCLKAALILQCFVEAFFFSMVVIVEYRCRKARNFPNHVKIVCYILYITSFMILVRCIVRTIEGFEAAKCMSNASGPPGKCGYISTHEEFLWVFEIANITLFVILLAVFHPGKYLPRSSFIFLDPIDGKTERVGPGFGKADKRPLLVTIIDPFNFYGIITGKGMKLEKFWESEKPIYDGGELPTKKKKKSDEVHKTTDASGIA